MSILNKILLILKVQCNVRKYYMVKIYVCLAAFKSRINIERGGRLKSWVNIYRGGSSVAREADLLTILCRKKNTIMSIAI